MAKKNQMGNDGSVNKVILEKPTRYFNNPYNFVPLAEKVYARYPNADALPCHDTTHKDLLCGEIHCTITAETPISVSDGKAGFFCNAKGDYVIPGSTLKGLVRSNMQILGFGAMRPGEDFNDSRLMYRVVATAADGVKKSLAEDYKNVLGIRSGESNPTKVKAGYLVQRVADKKYVIHPVSSFYRVNRKWNDDNDKEKPGKWEEEYKKEIEVWYQLNSNGYPTILKEQSEEQPEGTLPGVLLCTGKAVGDANHLYLFPAYEEKKEAVVLDNESVKTYLSDYEFRESTLKGTSVRNNDSDEERREDAEIADEKAKRHWRLPKLDDDAVEDTKPWPVFYINDSSCVYFGRSYYLRVGFEHSLKEGLPEAHRLAGEKLTLDYPYAILGFTWKESNIAYHSRVSFGDFVSNTEPLEASIPVALSQPKASYFPDYAENGVNYNSDFHIRGVKQYWLKDVQRQFGNALQSGIRSEIKVIPGKASFTGVIRFHNLHRDELGLLLWCLSLEKGCFQMIGKGKPLGYGRSKVTIDSVEQYLMSSLYSAGSLEGGSFSKPLNISELINDYKSHISKQHLSNRKAIEHPSVEDFLYIHKTVRKKPFQVRYNTMNGYRRRQSNEVMPTIKEQRKNQWSGQRQLASLCENMVVPAKILRVQPWNKSYKVKLLEYDIIGFVPFLKNYWAQQGDEIDVRILPGSTSDRLRLEIAVF